MSGIFELAVIDSLTTNAVDHKETSQLICNGN